jgi:hypothetical protein
VGISEDNVDQGRLRLTRARKVNHSLIKYVNYHYLNDIGSNTALLHKVPHYRKHTFLVTFYPLLFNLFA